MDSFAREASDRTSVKTSFVALPVAHDGRAWHTAGELREPLAPGPHPAIVLVHGSAGVDSRGKGYVTALNTAGFATFEIDLWAARGVTSPLERPKSVAETLPDAFAALDILSHRANVDPARIGIMGFSWGGIVSMLSATTRAQTTFAKDGQTFAAHAPIGRLQPPAILGFRERADDAAGWFFAGRGVAFRRSIPVVAARAAG